MATNRPLQILLLLLALVPTAIVIVTTAYLLLAGETATFNWQSKIWPAVVLHTLSISAFWAHASANKRLAPGRLARGFCNSLSPLLARRLHRHRIDLTAACCFDQAGSVGAIGLVAPHIRAH